MSAYAYRRAACTLAPLLAMALCAAVFDARAACPADPSAPADTLLSIQFGSEAPLRLGSAELARFAEQQRVQRRSVAASNAAASEQSVAYAGVLLRDVIASAPAYERQGRAQRWLTFEAVATDGYRAMFSWGELFNTDAAEHVLVIRARDGKPLDAAEGPLALRALADTRPGPRHVRNLCAIVARTAS
jgi:hypothetical protein